MLFRPQTMRVTFSVAAAMLMLSACATSSSTLLNGIDSDAIAQSADASSKVTRSAAAVSYTHLTLPTTPYV